MLNNNKISIDLIYTTIQTHTKQKHDISIIVDRIVLNSKIGNRLADSVETALNLSNGLLTVEYENETIPKNLRKKAKS